MRKASILSLAFLLAGGLGVSVAWTQHAGHDMHGGATPDQKAGDDKAKDEKPALPTCPVSGQPVNLYVSTPTDDGPVYFCCPACIAKYKAAPKDFADKVAAQRALLAKLPRVQVTCPSSGEPINPKVFTEKGGQKVYFCCADCKGDYEADPAKFKAKLAASYTYQTRCPVLGGPIDPTVFVDLPTKERVYFCCKGCDPKLLADPAKYAPKLAEQGYKIDVEKIKQAATTQKAAEKS